MNVHNSSDALDRGAQWFVFAGTMFDLVGDGGLTSTGLRDVRFDLTDGAWREDSLPPTCWEQRVRLLELVDGVLASGDEVLLEQYRMTDGLAIPDDPDAFDEQP
jgi:hypothetical protein